jgi:predicted O-linked N-acetylglucosamine transferase (SPINDLY family)
VDYVLTDEAATPVGTEREYSEKVWRMPSGSLMYGPPPVTRPTQRLPASANGFVTFGLFQREAKLNEPCWDAVARTLVSTAGSRLLVHHDSPSCEHGGGECPERILAALEARGVAASRVLFRGRRAMQEHLEILAQADLALDTFPYNGHTTTCECLWVGVPVVTLAGDRHAGRVGAGLLRQAGLDAWVARSIDGYVGIATRAAADIPALERLRSSLRNSLPNSPLLDTRTRTREIEDVYMEAWNRWRESVSAGNSSPS